MGPLNSHETISYRVLKGGCCNWGTLRIPFGKIGEP